MTNKKPDGYTADDAVNLNPDPNGPIIPQVNKNPEPIFRANKNKSKNQLIDINSKINKEKLRKNNAKLEKVELKTFGEYYQTLGEDPKDFPQMSPDRLVWVVQTYYPEGYKHPRVGLIQKAQVVGIFDAETGKFISRSFRSLEE